jgi:hypothetical protein
MSADVRGEGSTSRAVRLIGAAITFASPACYIAGSDNNNTNVREGATWPM